MNAQADLVPTEIFIGSMLGLRSPALSSALTGDVEGVSTASSNLADVTIGRSSRSATFRDAILKSA